MEIDFFANNLFELYCAFFQNLSSVPAFLSIKLHKTENRFCPSNSVLFQILSIKLQRKTDLSTFNIHSELDWNKGNGGTLSEIIDATAIDLVS